MNESLEERMKRLEIGRPDPTLRGKVLGAVEEMLLERSVTPAWYVEGLLTAGIVAAVALLLLIPEPVRPVPSPRVDQAVVQSIVEELQLDRKMEEQYRTRLNWSARSLAANRRLGHETRANSIEAF